MPYERIVGITDRSPVPVSTCDVSRIGPSRIRLVGIAAAPGNPALLTSGAKCPAAQKQPKERGGGAWGQARRERWSWGDNPDAATMPLKPGMAGTSGRNRAQQSDPQSMELLDYSSAPDRLKPLAPVQEREADHEHRAPRHG